MTSMKYILFITLSFVVLGCVEQIDFDLNETDNEYLIIDAELRDNDLKHEVSIKINSQQATDFQADFPVEGAEVYVIDDDNERYDFTSNSGQGIYENFNLRMVPGMGYTLFILYNGITYTSTREVLLESIPINDIRTILTTELINNDAGNISQVDLVNLFADADLPENEEVYIKYGAKGIYELREIGTQQNLNPVSCYVSEIVDLDNISLVSSFDIPSVELRNQPVITKAVDFRYAINYCMKIYQERISAEAYDFWKLVKNEYTRTGDIFERPPGVIRGNISEITETEISSIGLFSVAAVDSFLHLIRPSDVNSPRPLCQPFPPPPERCTNCLVVPKSTLTKPECF